MMDCVSQAPENFSMGKILDKVANFSKINGHYYSIFTLIGVCFIKINGVWLFSLGFFNYVVLISQNKLNMAELNIQYPVESLILRTIYICSTVYILIKIK